MPQTVPDVVIDEVVIKQVAAMVLTNVSVKDIAASLSVSQYTVRKIMATEEFKSLLSDIADRAVTEAVRACKSRMGDLMQGALRVLMVHLEANNLDAAKEVFKLAGVTQKDDKASQGAGTINVILPGARSEKVVPST